MQLLIVSELMQLSTWRDDVSQTPDWGMRFNAIDAPEINNWYLRNCIL